CKYYGASLTLLNVISKDASKSQETKLHNSNKELLRSFSREEDSLIIRSSDVVGVISEVSASYDLLIIGSQEKSAWYNVLLGLKSDRFVKNSVCSVLRLTINE
ncbi:MAG: universal stress protein, partial [Bacteroidota bacterium]|nr:universal stress protein [Bacteroidota bacterium]